MSLKLNLSILGIFLFSLCSAQIDFSQDSWENILAQAKKENKSIFVDVYTTWCGPCKKLSKTTFQDEALGKAMNASFISTKWDAESDAHENLADQYGVNSYPTLLYFNADGELIKKESGFKKVNQMQEMNEAFFAFVNNPDLRKRLDNYASLNLEETSLLLSELKGIKLKEKKNAALHLFKLLEDNEEAWTTNYEIVVDNISSFDDLASIGKIINYHPGYKKYAPSNQKELVSYLDLSREIKRTIQFQMRDYLNNNNLASFKECIKLENELSKKSSRFAVKESTLKKSTEVHLLDFYSKNEMKNEYAQLSEELINQYIIPANIESIRKQDEFTAKIMENKIESEPDFNVDEDADAEDIYVVKNMMAYRMASRLNEVSCTYMEFFEHDKEQLSKAKEWSLLSIDFLPLPDYYHDTAKLLLLLGETEEAKAMVEKGLASDVLVEHSEKKLKELQAELK